MRQYNHRLEGIGPQQIRSDSAVRPYLTKTSYTETSQLYHDDVGLEPVGRTEQQQLPNAKELAWERHLSPQKRLQHNTWMLKWVKVKLCHRREKHPWRKCPHRHRSEKVTRRDPWEFGYSFEACPDFEPGKCREGDRCRRAHGFFEKWMHPQVFRMQKCRFGLECQRDCCFFAHDVCQYQGDLDWEKLVPAPENSYVSEYQNHSQGLSLELKREQQHSWQHHSEGECSTPTRSVQLYPDNEDHGWPDPPPSALNSPRSTQSAFTCGSLASTLSSVDFPETPLTPPRFPPGKDLYSPLSPPSNKQFSHISHPHPATPSPLQSGAQPYHPTAAEGAPANPYWGADTWQVTSGGRPSETWESEGERALRILNRRHLNRQVADHPCPQEQAERMEAFYSPFERSHGAASGVSNVPRQSLFEATPIPLLDFGPIGRPHQPTWHATDAWASPSQSSYNEQRFDVDQDFSSSQPSLSLFRHTYIEVPNRVTGQQFYQSHGFHLDGSGGAQK